MRIVLDACVPERLSRYISGHNVTTVRAALGTTDFDDGALLDAIEHLVPLLPTLEIVLAEMQSGELRVLGL